jgi:hypothetical protein
MAVDGQLERHHRPPAVSHVGTHTAAMSLGDLPDDRQAEP